MSTTQKLRTVAAQLEAAAARLDGFASDGEPGQLFEARRVLTIACHGTFEAATDAFAIVDNELGSPDLANT